MNKRGDNTEKESSVQTIYARQKHSVLFPNEPTLPDRITVQSRGKTKGGTGISIFPENALKGTAAVVESVTAKSSSKSTTPSTSSSEESQDDCDIVTGDTNPKRNEFEYAKVYPSSESTPVIPFHQSFSDTKSRNSPEASQNDNESCSDDDDESSLSENVCVDRKTVTELFGPKDASYLTNCSDQVAEECSSKYYILDGATNESGDCVNPRCNLKAVLGDLKGFVTTPVVFGGLLRCKIVRNKKGIGRNLYPTYFLYVENQNGTRTLIMTARKRKLSRTSNYLMSVDPGELSRSSSSYVGKVRSNVLGTRFSIYDSGNSPKKFNYSTTGIGSFNFRQELTAVTYDTNLLGFRGPRKMKCYIPCMLRESERWEFRPDAAGDSLLNLDKNGDKSMLVELINKSPRWHSVSQSYVLNFHGRVSQASVKNFQIVHPDSTDYIILQFGRHEEDVFAMDVRYPICPLQAFGIVLTSFDGKIACD